MKRVTYDEKGIQVVLDREMKKRLAGKNCLFETIRIEKGTPGFYKQANEAIICYDEKTRISDIMKWFDANCFA